MVKESKDCSHETTKIFNKEVAMSRKYDEIFESSTKNFVDKIEKNFADGDIKVRDHFQFIGKYRDAFHRDCSIRIKLDHKIFIVFHNLKNFDVYLIIQKLENFDFQETFIPNELKKLYEL